MKYITTDINTPKKEAIMAELESVIDQKLIEQLIYGDSQWTYREDLKTEADLRKNFRYILEQNNSYFHTKLPADQSMQIKKIHASKNVSAKRKESS